jgi:hypothetical protein
VSGLRCGLDESAGPREKRGAEGVSIMQTRRHLEDLEDGDSIFSGAVSGTMFIRHPEGTAHAVIHAAKRDPCGQDRVPDGYTVQSDEARGTFGPLRHDGP